METYQHLHSKDAENYGSEEPVIINFHYRPTGLKRILYEIKLLK